MHFSSSSSAYPSGLSGRLFTVYYSFRSQGLRFILFYFFKLEIVVWVLTVVRSKVILLVQHFSCWAISFPVLIAFFVTFILPSLRFPSIARWLEPAEHHTSFWGQAPFLFYFYVLLSSASFIRFFLGSFFSTEGAGGSTGSVLFHDSKLMKTFFALAEIHVLIVLSIILSVDWSTCTDWRNHGHV